MVPVFDDLYGSGSPTLSDGDEIVVISDNLTGSWSLGEHKTQLCALVIRNSAISSLRHAVVCIHPRTTLR